LTWTGKGKKGCGSFGREGKSLVREKNTRCQHNKKGEFDQSRRKGNSSECNTAALKV